MESDLTTLTNVAIYAGGSCVEAGFTGCCVPTLLDDCGRDGMEGVERCFCDRDCYDQGLCCFDIAEVPCLGKSAFIAMVQVLTHWYTCVCKLHMLVV